MADIEQGVGGFGSHIRAGFRSTGGWVLNLVRRPLYWLLIVIALVGVVSLIAVFGILFLLFYMVFIGFVEKSEKENEAEDLGDTSSSKMEDIYKKAKPAKTTLLDGLRARSLRVLAKCGLLLLLWLLLNVSVPRLKARTLLGSPLWRWSLLAVVLTCSYFVAMLLYDLPNLFLCTLRGADRRIRKCLSRQGALVPDELEYDSLPHTSPSPIFTMYLGMVLVLWLFYFRTEAGLGHASTPPHPSQEAAFTTKKNSNSHGKESRNGHGNSHK